MNAELVDRIDSSDQWIRERSGIVSRRFAAPDETVVDMSEAAARQALDHAGLDPSRICAVLVATVATLRDTFDVVAPHGGRVVEWLVEDGDPVSPGQPIVRLHPQEVPA